jgi:hypothetical protein
MQRLLHVLWVRHRAALWIETAVEVQCVDITVDITSPSVTIIFMMSVTMSPVPRCAALHPNVVLEASAPATASQSLLCREGSPAVSPILVVFL